MPHGPEPRQVDEFQRVMDALESVGGRADEQVDSRQQVLTTQPFQASKADARSTKLRELCTPTEPGLRLPTKNPFAIELARRLHHQCVAVAAKRATNQVLAIAPFPKSTVATTMGWNEPALCSDEQLERRVASLGHRMRDGNLPVPGSDAREVRRMDPRQRFRTSIDADLRDLEEPLVGFD